MNTLKEALESRIRDLKIFGLHLKLEKILKVLQGSWPKINDDVQMGIPFEDAIRKHLANIELVKSTHPDDLEKYIGMLTAFNLFVEQRDPSCRDISPYAFATQYLPNKGNLSAHDQFLAVMEYCRKLQYLRDPECVDERKGLYRIGVCDLKIVYNLNRILRADVRIIPKLGYEELVPGIVAVFKDVIDRLEKSLNHRIPVTDVPRGPSELVNKIIYFMTVCVAEEVRRKESDITRGCVKMIYTV